MNNKLPSGYYIKPYRPITPIALARNVWPPSEIEYVLKLIQEKYKPEEIARKINRPISEVRSKLKVLAADMYIKEKLPYEKIHEITGVEKKSLILSPLTIKDEKLEECKDGDDHIIVNILKYDTEEDKNKEGALPKKIDIDVKENKEELTITVAFTAESICEKISTPVIRTFTMFSRFTKTIVGLEDTMSSSY